MKKVSVVTALFLASAAPGLAGAENISASLVGHEEVPSVSTVARGEFRGQISPDESTIDYAFAYAGLQGIVQQAHIHIAQQGVNGGIVIWLCGTASLPGPAGTRTCTNDADSFTGQIDASDVVAIVGTNAPQQVGANQLAKVIEAMRAGVAYVNVHTNLSPGGEIRGQIRASSKP